MTISSENQAKLTENGERKFYMLMIWEYISIYFMAAMFLAVSIYTNSSAIYVVAIQYLVSIVINSFAIYTMCQVLSENVYKFPFGAGKLENFSAFLSGFFYVPCAIYIIYDALNRLNVASEVG